MTGVVIKSTGSWYKVRVEGEEEIFNCRIVGKFRLQGLKLTNPVTVGDNVDFNLTGEHEGQIVKIHDRKNYVIRQSPRKKHFLHLLAANVDQALLLTTITSPNLKQGFIDRFLLMTEPYRIHTIIVFNKADLYTEEDRQLYDYLKDIYERIGYEVRLVSSIDQEGMEEIKELLKDKVTLIGGQSGVGKSTFILALDPELDLATGEISDYTGKGQHTTTYAEMFPLKFGGQLIDTPGIKTLSFNTLEPQDVTHNFRELFEASDQCKYSNCTHRNEPFCNVQALVETGEISILRYQNYIQLMEDIEEQNHWERRN